MSVLTASTAAFEAKIGDISRLANYLFRRLGPELREENVQNCLGLCWKYFVRLAEQGKSQDERVVMSMIGHAIKHTQMGRMPQGRNKCKPRCVMDYARRAKNGVSIEPADLDRFIGKCASVPDTVAFRVDTPAFLSTLSDRNRAIVRDLANGLGTGEVAHRWGVTPSAISEFRSRLRRRYQEFHRGG